MQKCKNNMLHIEGENVTKTANLIKKTVFSMLSAY